MRRRDLVLLVLVALVAAALLLLASGLLTRGEGTDEALSPLEPTRVSQERETPAEAVKPAPATAPEPALPSQDIGERLFDEAVIWVNGGAPAGAVWKSVHLGLQAKFDLGDVAHEGPIRLWLQRPDLYREELSMSGATLTRVLARGNLYVRREGGPFQHMNRLPEGAGAVAQAKDDMDRMADLTTLLMLAGLRGPGVTFEFAGEKRATGNFARTGGGTWAKVERKAPGRPNISFWFAHTHDASGAIHATYPGVVRVDGEPMNDVPTEDYVLGDWGDAPTGQARAFRYPRSIRGFRILPGEQPYQFLRAVVDQLALDTTIDPALFEPR